MQPVSPCPKPAQLHDYARGQASVSELETFARHLQQCPACAARESRLPGSGGIEKSLRLAVRANPPRRSPRNGRAMMRPMLSGSQSVRAKRQTS